MIVFWIVNLIASGMSLEFLSTKNKPIGASATDPLAWSPEANPKTVKSIINNFPERIKPSKVLGAIISLNPLIDDVSKGIWLAAEIFLMKSGDEVR